MSEKERERKTCRKRENETKREREVVMAKGLQKILDARNW